MEPPTVREVILRLKREGYSCVREKGDHKRFVKGSRRVTVAGALGEHLTWKTWVRVCEQAGWRKDGRDQWTIHSRR